MAVCRALLWSCLLVSSVCVFGLYTGPNLFLRSKRANSFLLEEILQGNLERECFEEICVYEEAREVFEDTHHTSMFWAQYVDGDQCVSAPCGHGGICTDGVGGFTCTCPAPFFGPTCELGPGTRPDQDPAQDPAQDPLVKASIPCPLSGPSSCEQLCTASDFSYSCSCLQGYTLRSDQRSCRPAGTTVETPCGQIPNQHQSNASHTVCTNQHCPWQVLVLDSSGLEICKGALLGLSSVLTSAHCVWSQLGPDLDSNPLFIRFSGQQGSVRVTSAHVHDRFSLANLDYDLALLHMPRPSPRSPAPLHLCVPIHRDHADRVLARHWSLLLVGGTGGGARALTLDECRRKTNRRITNKMFCLEREGLWVEPEEKGGLEAEQDDHHIQTQPTELETNQSLSSFSVTPGRALGTPVVSLHKGTAYIVGVLSSVSPAGGRAQVLIVTKLSRHMTWLQQRASHMTEQEVDLLQP
ncbi:unnamed protein product [Knipowitschia caucasica]|uniref:Protein Z, vitamin K-dependent plasma glycoprotein b n=1 Tax=Knipowitschia caucasica TaxID=637954 RepID=A0AAV2LC21_KNICA